MNRTPPLSTLVKKVIDDSPRSNWTSNLVRESVSHKILAPYAANPEDAPRTPTPRDIRKVLKDLTDLGFVSVTTHQEGRLRYNTYERIIKEPEVRIEYRYEHGKWGLPTLLLVGVCCFLMGWPL